MNLDEYVRKYLSGPTNAEHLRAVFLELLEEVRRMQEEQKYLASEIYKMKSEGRQKHE